MILTNKPLAEYLPDLKKKAYNSGYLWIMILVARDLDFKEGYEELFDGWSSFDSITGKRIMFLFSDNSSNQIGLNYHMGEMDICKDISGIFNFDKNIKLYHLSREDLKKHSNILETQTHSVDAMKQYFGLEEKEIPCLLMFPTMPDLNEKTERFVYELDGEKAYNKVKNIVGNIEAVLNNYEEVLNSDGFPHTLSKQEKKFLKAKEQVEARCCGQGTEFANPTELMEHLKTVDKLGDYLKKTYDHETISFINQYKALLENNRNVSINIETYTKEQEQLLSLEFESRYVFQNFLANGKAEKYKDSLQASKKIIEEYKEWVENRKGYIVIKDINEVKIQRTFDLCARSIGVLNDWDLSPETNSGPGPVDFKISKGNDKTVLEIKLTSNPNCVPGIEEQIEKYAKAEGTDKKLFLLINNGKNPGMIRSVLKKREEMVKAGKNPAEVIVIDATEKPSASKSK